MSLNQFRKHLKETVTKRIILKKVAANYGPPILFKGKLLIQRLWKKELSWDKAIPNETETERNDIEMD